MRFLAAAAALLGNDADTALAGHASDSQAYCARGCRGCSSIERLERLGARRLTEMRDGTRFGVLIA